MFRSTLRLTAVPAIATFLAMAPCAAPAQGFLDDIFGNSDRFSSSPAPAQVQPQPQQPQEPAQWQQQPGSRGTVAQGPGEMSMRIDRLEAQIRQLTGAIEQLQYRNQQLEGQLQRMQGGGGAPARAPAQPQVQPQMQPQVQPPASAPPPGGRRGDVFDPAQNPNAPGAPRVLGTIPSGNPAQQNPGSVAQPNPTYDNPNYDDEEVGAPGGRAAGAPLDLSTMAGSTPSDRAPSRPGMAATEPMAAPTPRAQGGGGAQVATLPPSDSPRDNYDLAYGYIMRKDYALAEDGFRNFLRRFPSDRLVPEAQYWLGESLFQRQRYRDAAEAFLGVSTKYETNARAPDALLRLGQSLAQMGEKEAACASLAEVLRKYPRASVAIRQGVDREQNAPAADYASPISAAEANALFDGLSSAPALLIAVSGGPDSTALMMLVARWRAALRRGPDLLAVTVDHGLRPESVREARAVKRSASRLGVRHRTLRWTGDKPNAGLQEAARDVRYRLLAAAARGAGATHVLTAHTRDDQAETVLMRLARGSGLTGLGGMPHETRIDDVRLVRPLLAVPKARLVATLAAVGMSFVDDPSNRDPRFTRARLRGLLPVLAAEGLDADRLALLARRLRRADETIELAVDLAIEALFVEAWPERGPIATDAERFFGLPAEVALRLLARAIVQVGDEGPVQLAKLEMLYEAFRAAALQAPPVRLRRTLAGALIALSGPTLAVEQAPPRRAAPRQQHRRLTTRRYDRRGPSKHR